MEFPPQDVYRIMPPSTHSLLFPHPSPSFEEFENDHGSPISSWLFKIFFNILPWPNKLWEWRNSGFQIDGIKYFLLSLHSSYITSSPPSFSCMLQYCRKVGGNGKGVEGRLEGQLCKISRHQNQSPHFRARKKKTAKKEKSNIGDISIFSSVSEGEEMYWYFFTFFRPDGRKRLWEKVGNQINQTKKEWSERPTFFIRPDSIARKERVRGVKKV